MTKSSKKRAKPSVSEPKGVGGRKSTVRDPDSYTSRAKENAPQCVAIKKNGERCKAAPIHFATVCRAHGGAAPQVKKAAKERLLELVDPAISQLAALLNREDVDDSTRLRAITSLLDRAGFGPGQTVTLQASKWDELIDDIAQGGTVELDRSMEPGKDRRALGDGGGEQKHTIEDAIQVASDIRASGWAAYDREDANEAERGRIRPTTNTVPGEVVGRYDAPPPRDPNDPPEY